MDKYRIEWNARVAQRIIENLENRRMEGSYAPTAEKAVEQVTAMVPRGSTVYRCGSITTTCIGLWKKLAEEPEIEVIDPYRPGTDSREIADIKRKGFTADIMIASSNAVTLDGKLVNLDGVGNRVAAMMFGPRKVILVVGMNKVAADLESAVSRIKHYAAPLNAIRLDRETPCAVDGLCADCRVPQRVCNMWSVIEGHREKGRIHVVLVGEDLGY